MNGLRTSALIAAARWRRLSAGLMLGPAALLLSVPAQRAYSCDSCSGTYKATINVTYVGLTADESNGDNPPLTDGNYNATVSGSFSGGSSGELTASGTGTQIDDDGHGTAPQASLNVKMQTCTPYTLTVTGEGGSTYVNDGYEPAGYSYVQAKISGTFCPKLFVNGTKVTADSNGYYLLQSGNGTQGALC